MGIEQTTSRFYSHTLCPCDTTVLNFKIILQKNTNTLNKIKITYFYKKIACLPFKKKHSNESNTLDHHCPNKHLLKKHKFSRLLHICWI